MASQEPERMLLLLEQNRAFNHHPFSTKNRLLFSEHSKIQIKRILRSHISQARDEHKKNQVWQFFSFHFDRSFKFGPKFAARSIFDLIWFFSAFVPSHYSRVSRRQQQHVRVYLCRMGPNNRFSDDGVDRSSPISCPISRNASNGTTFTPISDKTPFRVDWRAILNREYYQFDCSLLSSTLGGKKGDPAVAVKPSSN